ncbi:hypothetical protein DM01DRAFT_1371240 [Hesseltinella vesiculosa]|uniref:RRM domain-containing protein n=1 Tax=Hesseltinella vesiculosa TaxID=101127 RepID=A0A1X2GTF5_9FUNG|nr:hypothetical protein DM01DRAFT_1371240 [Hesseltinella vesiculosa]
MDDTASPIQSPGFATFPPLERPHCTRQCLTSNVARLDDAKPAYCYPCLYKYQDWFCQQTMAYTFSWSDLPCAKLSNIPWDVSQQDILQFFSHVQLPPMTSYAQPIHILMDRTTGKTLSDAYVEFASMADLQIAIETRHQCSLKGRVVSVMPCEQDELLKAVFPKWRGQFHGNVAVPPDEKVVRSMSTAAGGGNDGSCPLFVTREEINSLLVVCKNYKLHFSKKCVERPFENIISIVSKYPWQQADLITGTHRNLVFDMLRLSIVTLKKNHLVKTHVQVNPTLLDRLVRAGLLCPAFTQQQKSMLLQSARLDCPIDLSFVFMPYDQSPPMMARPLKQDITAMDYNLYPYSTSPSTSSSTSSTSSSRQPLHHQPSFDELDAASPSVSYPPHFQHYALHRPQGSNASLLPPYLMVPSASYPYLHDFPASLIKPDPSTPIACMPSPTIPTSPWRPWDAPPPSPSPISEDWYPSSSSKWHPDGFSNPLLVPFVKESQCKVMSV